MAIQDNHEDAGIGLGEIVAVFRRRAAWFAIPTLLGIVVAGAIALLWPAQYEGVAIIMVAPQEMPETIVAPTRAAQTETRFANIRLQILSRDTLSRVIDDLDLFSDFDGPREEAVIEMREMIRIAPLPPPIVDPRKPVEISSFEIAFLSSSPKEAANVANRLTRDFVAANLRARASEVEGTADFIDSELSKKKLEYSRVSDELSQYELDHSGELPSDMPVNQKRLDRARGDHSAAIQNLAAARKQVEKINAQLDEIRINGTDEAYDPVRRLRSLEMSLSSLRAQGKTDKHPDVRLALAEMGTLRTLIEQAGREQKPVSPEEATLRRELRNYEVRVGVLTDERSRLSQEIAALEELVLRAPEHATEIGTLETAAENLNSAIRDLQEKKVTADIARRAELAQKGEKFRIVESAEVPTSPVSPNRPLLFVVGVILGAFLGGLLLVLRETSDHSFHSVKELQDALSMPVLGTIPLIELPAELARARARMRRLVVAGVVLVSLAAGGGAAVYLLQDMLPDLQGLVRPDTEETDRV